MADPLIIPPAMEALTDKDGKPTASWYRLLQKLVQDHNRVSVEAAAAIVAADVGFDNAASGLAATQAQAAIDEVEDRIDTLEAAPTVVEVIAAGAIAGGASEVVIPLGDYDMVVVELNNVEPSDDGAALNAQVSQDDGDNYLAGASDYSWLITRVSNSAVSGAVDAADTKISIVDTAGNAAGEQSTFRIVIYRPAAASWAKTLTWTGHHTTTGGARHNVIGNGVLLANSDAITHLRLFWSAGTFDAGYRAALGYRFS